MVSQGDFQVALGVEGMGPTGWTVTVKAIFRPHRVGRVDSVVLIRDGFEEQR